MARASFYACISALALLLVGFNVGVMDGAVIYEQESRESYQEVEVATIAFNVLSLLGTLAAGRTCDKIGRRHSVAWAMIIFFLGRLLMISIADNYFILFLGRFFSVVGVGYILITIPVYVAEISPAPTRGGLTLLSEVLFNIGNVLGCLANHALRKVEVDIGWPILLWLGGISTCLLFIVIQVIPESPDWLIIQGRLKDAEHVLRIITDSNSEVVRKIDRIKRTASISQGSNSSVWLDFLQPSHQMRHMLICATSMQIFRQLSGADAIYDSPLLVSNMRITNYDKKVYATMLIDALKIIFMLFPLFLLDKVGRRPFMLGSVGGMSFTLILLVFFGGKNSDTVSTILTLAYVVAFSIGLGPITMVYSAEIFPVKLRALGTAAGVATNKGLSGVLSTLLLWLRDIIGFGWVVFIFFMFASGMWVLFYFMMPETQGKAMEKIGQLFGSYTIWREVANMDNPPINRDADDDTTASPSSSTSPPSSTAAVLRHSHRVDMD